MSSISKEENTEKSLCFFPCQEPRNVQNVNLKRFDFQKSYKSLFRVRVVFIPVNHSWLQLTCFILSMEKQVTRCQITHGNIKVL